MPRYTRERATEIAATIPIETLTQWAARLGDRATPERVREAFITKVFQGSIKPKFCRNSKGVWNTSLDTMEREIIGEALDDMRCRELYQVPHHRVSLTLDVDLPLDYDTDRLRKTLRYVVLYFTGGGLSIEDCHAMQKIVHALDPPDPLA